MFFLIFLLLILVGGGLAVIVMQNLAVTLHITLFSWQSPDLPVGLWIVGAFFLGALLLYLVSLVSAWHDLKLVKKLKKRVAELEQQAQQSTPPMPAAPPINGPTSSQPTGPMMQMPGVMPSGSGPLLPQNYRQ